MTAWQALFVGGHLFCERATIKFLVGSTVQLSKKVILFFYYLNFSKLKNSFGFVFVIKSLIFIFIHCAPKKNYETKTIFCIKGTTFFRTKIQSIFYSNIFVANANFLLNLNFFSNFFYVKLKSNSFALTVYFVKDFLLKFLYPPPQSSKRMPLPFNVCSSMCTHDQNF